MRKKILKSFLAIVLFCFILYHVWYFVPYFRASIQERYDFDQITSVVFYAISPSDLGSVVNLSNVRHAEFDLELFKDLITHVEFYHPYFLFNRPIWKGGYLAVVTFSDGKKLDLAVSIYGSFFSVIGESGYYVLRGSDSTRWKDEYRNKVLNRFSPDQVLLNPDSEI